MKLFKKGMPGLLARARESETPCMGPTAWHMLKRLICCQRLRFLKLVRSTFHQ